jgi:glycerophosphoryl diester phosphodiesterase
MKILAHRGHWLERPEMNSFHAFERAWSGGHGIETDLRDLEGGIVVSHDPPERGVRTLDEFLAAYAARGAGTPLALNIKADGLQSAIAKSIGKYRVRNFFLFDMSVPDGLHYLRAGMPVFVRLSEYEPETALLDLAAGVWLDAFETEWWTLDTVRSLHSRGKTVAIVSPELHKRPHETLWRTLKDLAPETRDRLMLCTDFPDAASEAFAE